MHLSSGEIADVGPTMFEFVVPEGAPLTVSPAVGTVLPGQVSYSFTVHYRFYAVY